MQRTGTRQQHIEKEQNKTNELINLINQTDTASPAELTELYKEIIASWEQLNK